MKKIPGWFDFADIYNGAVDRARDGAQLIEVGCWYGKSLRYLLERAKESGKDLHIVGVDHFQGSSAEPVLLEEASRVDIRAERKRNCDAVGYQYRLMVMPSTEAARWYLDGTLDFVFLDGAHDYDSVFADIAAWMPKIRPGGMFAGHDYNHKGVRRAVDENVGKIKVIGSSWTCIRRERHGQS